MKITKRIISLIAAVAVLATMFVAVPVSAATTTTDLLKIDFNDDAGNDPWTLLDVWDDTEDGFYGAAQRYNKRAKVVASEENTNYLQVGSSGNVNQIIFKNVGKDQKESNVTDDAAYFDADSMFGTPYYVQMRFKVPALGDINQLFGQHFEGILDETPIVSTGPRIDINGNGLLSVSDGLSGGSKSDGRFGTNASITANTWHTLKVYVDPANRTYQVWLGDTAVQVSDKSVFTFGQVYHNNTISSNVVSALDTEDKWNLAANEASGGTSVSGSSRGGGTKMILIEGQNVNEYLAEKGTVLAPNRTRIQNTAELLIDDLYMYRVTGEEDPVEPEEPEDTDGETVIKWTFDDETTGNTRWTELSVWSDGEDGFYGAQARYNSDKGNGSVVAHTATGKSGKYIRLSASGVGTNQFKNVGADQTEGNAVDDAQYFGANSIFGKPYYVEFDFSLDSVAHTPQIFGQHFEGTLPDGTTGYTSGPRINVHSTGYLQFANGFTEPTVATASDIMADSATVKREIKPEANTWYHIKVYVDPVARTYQVWFDGYPVQLAVEEGTEPTAFEFGAVQNNAGGAPSSTGNTTMKLIGGENPNEYIKGEGIVLAPNRTRFQAGAGGLSIDELHIYYPPERDLIASEIIAAFNAAYNNGAIAEGTDSITLPGLPSKYDSSKYTVSWSSDNKRITTTTGAIADGIESDAVLTVTVTEGAKTATATAKVSLPFSFTSWVANPVPYEISGIKFQDVDAEEDSYIYSPVAGGTLSSAQFKNNTQNAVNLIAAAYDASGRLAACKVVGGPDDGEVAIDLDIPATATNPVVKFFVWSADDKLTPLTTSAQVFEEAGRKLVIISDSRITEGTTTMGAVLADKFDTTKLPITDLSVVGTTLKRYATEEVSGSTRLQTALAAINPGDYVMLSFGHNDRYDTTWGEPTTAGEPYNVGSFGYYYLKYVEAIRRAGGVPIIVTPAPKGTFYANGTSSSELKVWSTHTYNVATDYDVPFLNLHEEGRSGTQIDSENPNLNCLNVLGKTNSEAYYDADKDLLTADGAEWIADMLVDMMTVVKLPFVKYLTN